MMIALDTNILARFYVDDPADPESARQRPIARRLLTESLQVFVPLTVILELEWVLRAFYGFAAKDFVRVVKHLLGLPNVSVEEWSRIMPWPGTQRGWTSPMRCTCWPAAIARNS
jgi:predicted nucleic-acid-binding protein